MIRNAAQIVALYLMQGLSDLFPDFGRLQDWIARVARRWES